MKSFSYIALLSALASLASAGNGPDGVDVLIDKIQPQNHYPQTSDKVLKAEKPQKKEYEYIVVGSGPGGAPLAANLAIAGHSVLLVDAGGDYGHLREVESPALANPSSERNEVSWGFFTHHYENMEMALKDRKYTWLTPDGKYYSGVNVPKGSKPLGNWYPRYGGLGGCAEHNALVALLPSKNDWDHIKNVTGDKSWDNAAMRKYLKKLEKVEYPLPAGTEDTHGFNGYLSMAVNPPEIPAQDIKMMSVFAGAAKAFGVDNTKVVNAINDAVAFAEENSIDYETGLLPLNMTAPMVEAMAEMLEWDINKDSPDRDTKRSFARLPQHMDSTNYRRSTPRDFVYDTVTAKNPDGSKRFKLDVALNTLATKVTFDTKKGKKPKATGIEYLFGQSLYRADPRASETKNTGVAGSVKATKEVIVAGGAFNSPQLLKLSGVGPKAELKKFGIPVVLDLPGVGENLQDRLETSVNAEFPTNFTRVLACYYLGADGDPCWAQYVDPNNKGAEKGTYASNGVVMGSFFTSSFSEDGEHDLWIGGFPALFNGFYPGYSSNAATPTNKNYWSWLVLKAHTRNHAGTVKLRSTNPRDTPIIHFHNTYEGQTKEEADKDVGALREGMKMALSFFENIPAIDGAASVFWPPKEVSTDAQLDQWITEEAWGHHASCSNKIGADNDPMAVLDSKFRVRGAEGLRVVDASSLIRVPGVFPVLPIMMMSEKATEDILAADADLCGKPKPGKPGKPGKP